MITNTCNRYGDGPRMISLWKHNLLQYLDNNHPKYLIYAVRLLTSINGGVSQRLKEEILWNRTVNQNGGAGNNIAMDLMIEFLNKGFKGAISYMCDILLYSYCDNCVCPEFYIIIICFFRLNW